MGSKIKSLIKRIVCVWTKLYYKERERKNPTVKIEKNRINLIWWSKKKNLGDYLSRVVCDWMAKEYSLNMDKECKKTKSLMAIGSVITFAIDDATVWGSGILGVNEIPVLYNKRLFRKLDIRAVRGPFTRHVLLSSGYDCPEVYGDPAIIMPYIYKGLNLKKTYAVSIVQHHSRIYKSERKDFHYINIETHDYKQFIDEICSSKKIISSSLHGIILAETYGVPAVFFNDGMEDQLFKFWDWYLSTGRTDIRMAKTLEEALEMEPMPLPQLDEMRDNLIKCFPVDLWKED